MITKKIEEIEAFTGQEGTQIRQIFPLLKQTIQFDTALHIVQLIQEIVQSHI